jgi:hypothetical protein
MEEKATCRICSTSILKVTSDRTNGLCMPCSKDPDRLSHDDMRLQKLKDAKVIQRTLARPLDDEPAETLAQFTSLLFCDGLDQVDEDELVAVLHCLQFVQAPKCTKAVHDLLNFIEKGCSPDGYFDPALVGSFLFAQCHERLPAYEEAYKAADQEEKPIDQLQMLADS